MTSPVTTRATNGDSLTQSILAVHRKIAPVWPLRDYVAVNPFMGFASSDVYGAALDLRTKAGIRLTMPREFYRKALETGVILDEDLAAAAARLGKHGSPALDQAQLREHARQEDAAPTVRFPTVAGEVPDLPVDAESVIDHISAWACAYFDRALAKWPSPWGDIAPWQAFRMEVELDDSLDRLGVGALRSISADVGSNSLEVIERGLAALEIPTNGQEDYLHCLALSIAGWCGFARQRDWMAETDEAKMRTFRDVLAIRVVWDWALLSLCEAPARETWRTLVRRYYSGSPPPGFEAEQRAVAADVALQWAYERGRQRQLIGVFETPRPTWLPARSKRVQAVFCIDVRSEVYRRALEGVAPHVETLGFAGFFGFPIAVSSAAGAAAQCPVLLSPSFEVPTHSRTRTLLDDVRTALGQGYDEAKSAAVSSFTFVEAWGGSYVPKLVSRLFRRRAEPEVRPALDFGSLFDAKGKIDLTDDGLVAAAHNAVRGMALGAPAELVLLVGHEADCANNPHAAGLQCGACGGHSGATNALFAAKVLNDRGVRAALAARGCHIPEETWFAAAVHKTTTDEIVLLNREELPIARQRELEELKPAFAKAGEASRVERELVRSGEKLAHRWSERSRDWSEPRPELGLAGCQAFVVAPRSLTRGLDFGGRAFMHSYDWKGDPEFRVLEGILTAPLVVTNWINLQYFASTVDPGHFGCGNKVLHNVVGNFGVLEGRGGDLRVGLSKQSVSEGDRLFHDPVKLNVLIAAPTEAISDILSKHPNIRCLADNGWLYLWALSDDGRVVGRYDGELKWSTVSRTTKVSVAA